MHACSAIGLLALTFLVSLAAPLAGAQIMVPVSSSFDADAHGWTGDNPGEFFFEATGGNPDGFLHFDDIAPAGGVAIAPSN